MKIHPYAIILGVGVALMVLASLKQPAFAAVAGLLSTIGFSQFIQKRFKDDSDTGGKDD